MKYAVCKIIFIWVIAYTTGLRAAPSITPSYCPSGMPSETPSSAPSLSPVSSSPTDIPTYNPSAIPSAGVTISVSDNPSSKPSETPSSAPSSAPSSTSSESVPPSSAPTSVLSSVPTAVPIAIPTAHPSAAPILFPSISPTDYRPTALPSGDLPTTEPTAVDGVPLSIFTCGVCSTIYDNVALIAPLVLAGLAVLFIVLVYACKPSAAKRNQTPAGSFSKQKRKGSIFTRDDAYVDLDDEMFPIETHLAVFDNLVLHSMDKTPSDKDNIRNRELQSRDAQKFAEFDPFALGSGSYVPVFSPHHKRESFGSPNNSTQSVSEDDDAKRIVEMAMAEDFFSRRQEGQQIGGDEDELDDPFVNDEYYVPKSTSSQMQQTNVSTETRDAFSDNFFDDIELGF